MSSRREEERNEKIIRGLMKLPPNRRCINCNSLVPQYVCTNFWTFVCTTCSGIHREFTHRVKSVSMAKFTTQELEALQNGGNQRAREIYLKEWDAQNLRLPDNSKPDKIREFIKNVYVDKKYVGGKSSEKASRDMQLSSQEDESRRASSYHSYSQSPPYDFQYEERKYGKRTSALSRKPGSDRGLYDRKFSGFLSPSRLIDRNPNHLTDRVSEDRFGMERSNSRASDCSISGGGDPFKSDIQSPNFQIESGSLSSETSREFSSEDLNYLRNSIVDLSMMDGGRMSHSQRTASSPGSYGVHNNQLLSSKSNDFTGFVDIASEPGQTFEAHSSNTSALPSLSQSSLPMNFDGLDLFNAPFAPQNVTSTVHSSNTSALPSLSQSSLPMNFDGLDLFNAPFAPQNVSSTAPIIVTSSFPDFSSKPPVDLFQSTLATNFSSHQVAQACPPSPALFSETPQQPPAAFFAEKSSDVVVPTNEGWATFDFPQHIIGAENSATMKFSCDKNSLENSEQCTPNQWPSSQDVSSYGPSSAMHLVRHNAPSSEAIPSIANTQIWNAFEDSSGQLQFESAHGSSKEALEFQEYGNKSVPVASSTPVPNATSHSSSMPLHDISGISVGGYSSFNHVSTNPFDLPYDPAEGYSNVSSLWDMSSLQAALPNGQMPTSFTAAANQTWFSDDQSGPFCPVGPEGVQEFISGQGSSKQLMNGQTQGHVASVGGNPFA